jgi:hypothetical protein
MSLTLYPHSSLVLDSQIYSLSSSWAVAQMGPSQNSSRKLCIWARVFIWTIYSIWFGRNVAFIGTTCSIWFGRNVTFVGTTCSIWLCGNVRGWLRVLKYKTTFQLLLYFSFIKRQTWPCVKKDVFRTFNRGYCDGAPRRLLHSTILEDLA